MAIDRDLSGVSDLTGHPGLETLEADLENGSPFPFAGRHFAGVVVTNFLHRPLMPDLVAAVETDGLFIYERLRRAMSASGAPRIPTSCYGPASCSRPCAGACASWLTRIS